MREKSSFISMSNRSLKLPKNSHNLSPQTDQGGIIRNLQQKENVKEALQT